MDTSSTILVLSLGFSLRYLRHRASSAMSEVWAVFARPFKTLLYKKLRLTRMSPSLGAEHWQGLGPQEPNSTSKFPGD